MRVVVVGATGNVGTSLVTALLTEPSVEEVVGIARRLPSLRLPRLPPAAAPRAPTRVIRTPTVRTH